MSPRLRRAVRLAKKMVDEDYGENPDDVEDVIYGTLGACYEAFDPSRGDPEIPEDDRFVRYFRWRFRRAMNGRPKAGQRRESTLRYLEWKESIRETSGKAALYRAWSEWMYAQAVRRLSREAQTFLRLRYGDGLTVKDVARRMGLSERKIKKYSVENLVRIIRHEIGEMVGDMNENEALQLVWRLYVEEGFEEDEIARLLCIPVHEAVDLIRASSRRIFTRMFGEDFPQAISRTGT